MTTDVQTETTQEPTGLLARLSAWIVGRFMGGDPKTAREMERFLKFSVVGTIGFVVDFGTNAILVALLRPKADDPNVGLITVFISTTAFVAAVINNFTWNRYWTYPDSRSKPILNQLVQFTIVNVIAWIIRSIVLLFLQSAFAGVLRSTLMPDAGEETLYATSYFPALVIAVIIVLFWNFFINRYWTYNDVD
ncbi:MAG: GtrA family protein [Anaerolineae bacterium]|nr:GtrA family protein [Anaerolineae bacterium]